MGAQHPCLHVWAEGHGERHGRVLQPARREGGCRLERVREDDEEGWTLPRGGLLSTTGPSAAHSLNRPPPQQLHSAAPCEGQRKLLVTKLQGRPGHSAGLGGQDALRCIRGQSLEYDGACVMSCSSDCAQAHRPYALPSTCACLCTCTSDLRRVRPVQQCGL